VLDAALALWSTRDDSARQPGVREAANTAVEAIDALVHELHRVRQRLVTETRAADDANARRLDAMLSAGVNA